MISKIKQNSEAFIISALRCILTVSAFTQEKSTEDEELKLRLSLRQEIIQKSRKAMYKGIKPEEVKSVYFKLKGKPLEK